MNALTDLDLNLRTLVLGTVGAVVTAAVAYALYSYLTVLLFTSFAYYASRPVYRRLVDYTDHPDLAVTATILVYTVPIVALLGYGLYVTAQQLLDLFSSGLLQQYRWLFEPYLSVIEQAQGSWRAILHHPRRLIDQSTRRLLRMSVDPAITVAQFLFSMLAKSFLLVVFLFYLLRDDHKIAAWFRQVVHHDSAILKYFEGVDDQLQTVFFGNLLTIVVTSAIAIAVYWSIDFVAPAGSIAVPFLLGAITGLGTMVPGIGMKLVYIPYSLYLLFDALTGNATPLWVPAAFFVLTLVFVDTIPDYFVRSYLSAGDITLGLIMLAYILGTMVWGWTGLFLGPVVLVAFLQFAHQVAPAFTAGRLGE